MISIFVSGHYEIMLTYKELLRLVEDQQKPLNRFKERLVDVFEGGCLKYSVMDARYSSHTKMHSVNVLVDQGGQKQIRVWVILPNSDHRAAKTVTYLDISLENERGFMLKDLTLGEKDYLSSCLSSGIAANKEAVVLA